MLGMIGADKNRGQSDTEMCSRAEFLQHTATLCKTASDNAPVSVVVLDMDRFRTINSALGHEFGYRVLEQLGRRIVGSFPGSMAISHLGNDEFAVLLTGEQRPRLKTITTAALKEIRQTILLDEQSVLVTASAGVALRREPLAADATELLQQASIAANEAQRNGGNNCVFYTAAVKQQPLRKLDLELDLRRALAADDLRVFYQPIFDLRAKRICGLEALARWKHADLGWIKPTEFIPVAEESGLIAEVGESVLHKACADTAELLQANIGLEYLAVNFAAQQIEQRHFARTTERILQRLEFPASKLLLEITESDFLASEARIINSLEMLRNSGIRIAIDDFGTGYSSLRVLKEFPADVLKIDRQFVQQAHCNHVDSTITRAVIDIAHSLNLKVVAEGVETNEQLEFLRGADCDFIQGYLVGKAVAASQLPSLFSQ